MFCPQCGNKRLEEDKYCAFCGVSLDSPSKTTHNPAADKETVETSSSIQQNVVLRKPVIKSIIDGRMARKEFAIITFVPYLLGVFFAIITDGSGINEIYYIVVPVLVLWFLFGYFAAIRRLHDLNKSAWWLLLIGFSVIALSIKKGLEMVGVNTMHFDTSILGFVINIIAIGGFVLLISLIFVAGTKGENKYGKPPIKSNLSWRSIIFNIQNKEEVLDKTYLYGTTVVYTLLVLLITIYFLN